LIGDDEDNDEDEDDQLLIENDLFLTDHDHFILKLMVV
jgi:hypothetical protein